MDESSQLRSFVCLGCEKAASAGAWIDAGHQAAVRTRPSHRTSALAAHFLKQAARRLQLPPPRFTEAHARLLQSYDWPGNVRELQNAAERALILAQKGALQFDLLPGDLGAPPPLPVPGANGAETPILTEIEWRQRERENMRVALANAGWRIHGEGGAAELLGLKPTTLISRMKKMGLKRPAPAEERA